MTRVADDAGWRPDAAAPADPDPVRRAAPSDPFGGVTRMGDSLGLVDPSLLEVTGAPRVEAPATPPADTDKAARVTARLGGGGVADDDGPDDREPATGRALGRRAPGAPARGARVRATAPRPRPPPPPPLRAVSEGDTRDTEVRDRLDRADSAAGTQRVPRVTERDLRGGSVADEEVTQESRRSAPTADPPDDDEMLDLDRGFPRPYSETVESLAPDGSTIEAPLALFAALPDDAVAELVRRMSKRTVPAGNIVLHEGDPGDACFVIASGEVRVLKRDPRNAQSDLIEVARLGTGSIFGAFALLADRRRHATVQAVADTALYRIPRTLLRELAANYPAVGPALQRFYRERLLATLLSTAPFFGPIEQERRTELLARFAPIRMESGERVVTEGAPAGGLYLIVLGTVEITKRVAGQRSVRLSTLGEGAYFGELSLMRGGVARATVTAAGPTELAKLPARDFYDIVAAYPVLWERLRQEAHRRELMMSQLVAGDTGVV
jgi:CRP-like cAMP-binding protein